MMWGLRRGGGGCIFLVSGTPKWKFPSIMDDASMPSNRIAFCWLARPLKRILSVQTLDAARAAMRRQKGIDGVVVIDADPRYLVVPAAKQTTAEQVTTAITPAQTSNVNPFAGRLAVLAEPRLDDASTTAWYLAADPANVATFEFAYLDSTTYPLPLSPSLAVVLYVESERCG